MSNGRGRTLKGLMVRSTLTPEDFAQVYSILDVAPLDGDCGGLCEKRCCQEYEPGVGMYLLPGEDCMFDGNEPWLEWRLQSASHQDFPPEWNGMVYFVMCRGTCPRERRPIQCRTFPLMPYLDPEGNLEVRLDTLTGSLLCPMVRYPESYPLRKEFMDAVLSAWRILIKDPLIRADVLWQSRKLDQDNLSPWRKLLSWRKRK